MAQKSAWIALLALTGWLHAAEVRVASFNIGAHLVVPGGGEPAYFDYGIGPPGQPDHDTVRDVLARIDADIVALEEIHAADVVGPASDLDALAASLGYPHVFVCPTATAFDSSLRVAILSRFPFLETAAIASPPGARDMTRLMPVVRVDVPGTANDPLIIAAHLKSGSAASDLFQRTAEMRRLTNHLTNAGVSATDNFIITGDFNLSATSRTFTTVPASGLPGSFALGDTTLPLDYFTDPRAYFSAPPVTRILPRQLDGSAATYPTSSSSIDLLLTSPQLGSRPQRTEIYNSALEGIGGGLPKAGVPLAAGTSLAASDHLAIFGDFELDPAVPYPFHAAGETVTESFAGFPGTYDPYPWVTTGGNWIGTDDGRSHTPGFRSYGPAADPSLGILTGSAPATATVSFINASPALLNALKISFTAGQWRSANGGTASQLTVELLDGSTVHPLPALDFTASTALPDGPLAGGVSTPRSALIRGLVIPPGATFQLRFTFGPATPAPAEIFVNSFHYDNAGSDQSEFIDIVAGPGFSGNFSDLGVLLYNGADGKPYKQLALNSTNFTRTTAPGNFVHFVAELGSMQNDKEGIAIVHTGTREVIEFISYEGTFTATEGIAAGATSVDIGVFENGSDPVGQSSLGRVGSGGIASDFTWAKISGPPSRGTANVGQTLASTTPPPQGIAIDNLAVTFLADSDGDGMLDIDELVFGTDPDDAGSRFTTTLERTESGAMRITFPTLPGRTYTVETGIDLLDWIGIADFTGNGSTLTPEFPVTPGEPARYYRIRVSLD